MQPLQSGQPFFVLDNGLNPHIATALASLGYRIRSVQDEFSVTPQDSVSDPEIINHIATYYGPRGAWITKDNSAKRAHIALIKSRRISVIWIRPQTLSTLQQHRIITFGLARVTQDLLEANHPIHYLVTFHGQHNRERINYKIEWQP